ncbi:hypothetical protein PHMEG_00037310 [Phytophthora megakarya]|uniref:Uncharacterized protein n=1 Tax=Phytophthora megakarya TaxID=4795 RepID=A0A225UJU8_9STRA|nr:hypothetical protein PHMEG_00037310 [Phytophthora megakarya]
MPALDELDELRRQGYTDVDFHVVDPNKRSRFQGKDLCTLIRIVTRRKSYSAPHGTGEDEWQQVADALNQATTASFSFRACRDKVAALLKDHKRANAVSRRASGITEKHTGLSDLVEGYLQLKTRFDERQQQEKDKKNRKKSVLLLLEGKQCAKQLCGTSNSFYLT